MVAVNSEDREMVEALWRHGRRRQLPAFLAQGDACGWCSHPIRLRGTVMAGSGDDRRVTFSSATLPDGVVLKACGARSELRCPACAAMYRGDSRHLVRAGLEGGKGVDVAVATHPAVFVTLTAPSFGSVHGPRSGGACQAHAPASRCPHGRPLSCAVAHRASGDLVGTPLCPDCYDYTGAVLHNASTPELWRRTAIYVQRHLAAVMGITQAEAARRVRLASCRVAEFQRRGLVHLHAVIRADGPDGSAPPVDSGRLAEACVRAARTVSCTHPGGVARWGHEVDVQVLGPDDRARRVGTYVAKYSTKSSAEHPGLEYRIASEYDLAERNLPDHLHRTAATAWSLGGEPDLEALRLRRYAHRLGYGGHFLSKSRTYSTTFRSLRAARATWREEQRNGAGTSAEAVTEGRWRAVGGGWATRGEEIFAAHQQRQRAEERREAEFEWYTRSE